MDDTTATIIGVLIVVMAVVTYFELRVLRNKSKKRKVRAAQRPDELQDEAHNALITTRAIISAMTRTGVRSLEAVSLMDEAQGAYDRRNYRVTVELTGKAKSRLMALKSEQRTKGDLAKLDAPLSGGARDEPTTKERLQKEFPAGLAQARFAMGLAESSVSGAKAGGREVAEAEELLIEAQDRFNAQDYEGALRNARLAQKSAAGLKVEVIAPVAHSATAAGTASPIAAVCGSCGAPLKADDLFCRKCGAKVEENVCATCGADLASDDAFCRKCGTRIAR